MNPSALAFGFFLLAYIMKLNKKQIFFLIFLIAGTIFIAINNNQGQTSRGQVRKFTERIFGTQMSVTYTHSEDLRDTIMSCLREVDASLSMFNPKSTLSRINRGETDSLDEHLSFILPTKVKNISYFI